MAGSVVRKKLRVDEMFEFINAHDEFFIGLGKTSEWSDEKNPPDPTGEEDSITELFGLVKSKVPITAISADVTIGAGTNGQVTITADQEGSSGNDYQIEVIDNSGTADVAMSASLTDTLLTLDLGTDGSSNLDDSKNAASLVASEIDTIPEFTASDSGDGSTALDADDCGTFDFTDGEGPKEKCVFLKEDSEGDILYRDVNYSKVYKRDAYSELPLYLYFEALISVDEFTSIEDYRQLGIFYGVQRASGVPSDEEVLDYPDEVDDLGTLYSISNVKRVARQDERYERITMLVEY